MLKKVLWYDDLADTTFPKEMLPKKIRNVFFNKNATMMIALFDNTTSSDETMEAVSQMRHVVGKQCFISGMSGIVTDIEKPGTGRNANLCGHRCGDVSARIVPHNGIPADAGPVSGKHRHRDPV